jgi:hypothetical protein
MALLVVLGIFLLLAVATGIWGVDSRPGFDGGRDHPRERWFFHSKTD